MHVRVRRLRQWRACGRQHGLVDGIVRFKLRGWLRLRQRLDLGTGRQTRAQALHAHASPLAACHKDRPCIGDTLPNHHRTGWRATHVLGAWNLAPRRPAPFVRTRAAWPVHLPPHLLRALHAAARRPRRALIPAVHAAGVAHGLPLSGGPAGPPLELPGLPLPVDRVLLLLNQAPLAPLDRLAAAAAAAQAPLSPRHDAPALAARRHAARWAAGAEPAKMSHALRSA